MADQPKIRNEELVMSLTKRSRSLGERISQRPHEAWLLTAAVAHLGDGVMITDNTLDSSGPIITFANAALGSICGYPLDEIIGQSLRLFQGPNSYRPTLEDVNAELKAGRPCRVELIYHRKDGSEYEAELCCTPIKDSHGECTNCVIVVRDVSQRNAVERAFKAREGHLRALLESAEYAIVTYDSQGLVTSVNEATTRMFGYSRKEMIGKDLNLLMPPPLCPEQESPMEKCLKPGGTYFVESGRELSAMRKNGEVFAIQLSISANDVSNSFTGIIRDLSSHQNLQKRLLAIAADQQRDIGEKLREGIGQTLAGLSLLAGTLDNELNHFVPRAPSDNMPSKAQKITKRLLDGLSDTQQTLYQVTQDIMPVQEDSEGLRASLQQLVRDTSALPNVHCQFNCPGPIVVENNIAATHLYRIAKEAIRNAIHFRPSNSIALSLTRQGSQIVLTIEEAAQTKCVLLPPPLLDGRSEEESHDSMQFRARLIGGHLTLEQTAKGGRLVQCSIQAEQD